MNLDEVIKFNKKEDLYSYIFNNYTFINKDDINKHFLPSIEKVNNEPYILLPDPNLSIESIIGLAVKVEGEVYLKDSLLEGGRTRLYVFAKTGSQTLIEPIKRDCKGMMVELTYESEDNPLKLTGVQVVKNVHMAINTISNYLLQVHLGGGLFGINHFMIKPFSNLLIKGLKDDFFRKNISKELYESFLKLKELYIFEPDEGYIPVPTIINRVKQLVLIDNSVMSPHDYKWVANLIIKSNDPINAEEYDEVLGEILSAEQSVSDLITRESFNNLLPMNYDKTFFKLLKLKPEYFNDETISELLKHKYSLTMFSYFKARPQEITKFVSNEVMSSMISNGYNMSVILRSKPSLLTEELLIKLIEAKRYEDIYLAFNDKPELVNICSKRVIRRLIEQGHFSTLKVIAKTDKSLFDEKLISLMSNKFFCKPVIKLIKAKT